MFGPYPFTELGGVVPAHPLWFDGLETQTRPVYVAERDPRRRLRRRAAEPRARPHVVRRQRDRCGSGTTSSTARRTRPGRSGASWSAPADGSANDGMNATYERRKDEPEFWQVTMIDPSREHLFDAVYVRGPMALQALRNVIGDEAFFKLAAGLGPGHRAAAASRSGW